jgi:sarcosine oxidase, subunit beta
VVDSTIVIIGGGVIGLSTAYQLARKGVGRVVLLDKGSLGDGASVRAAGIGTHLMWSETGVRARTIGFKLFRQFSDEWDDYTFHNEHGCLNLFTSQGWTERAKQLPLYRRLDVAFEELDAKEIHYRWPALHPPEDFVGLFDPHGGYSEPDEYIAALTKRVRQLGVEIREREPVVDFLRRGDRVVGVRTPQESIEADAVVSTVHVWSLPLWRELSVTTAKTRQLARVGAIPIAGEHFKKPSGHTEAKVVTPHSRLSARSDTNGSTSHTAAFRLPIKHFVHQRYVTTPLSKPFVAPAVNADPYLGYIRPAFGNRMLMGIETTDREECSVKSCDFHMNELAAPLSVRDEGRKLFLDFVPMLDEADWESEHVGLISFTSDGEPVLGPVRQLPGLFVAASFHSGGFSYNAVAGQLMAELVVDGQASIDVRAFSPDRFDPAATEQHLATTVRQCEAVRRRH